MKKRKGKGRKVRVDFRKNRETRTRRQNLTHDVLDRGLEDVDLGEAERISGKGRLSRRRTVIGVETEDGEIVREVDESNCLRGRVIESIGLHNLVRGDDGHRYECTVRRVVRTLARDTRNVVVTGDHVLFQPVETGRGVIERVEPRRATLSRFSQRREHVIVSNVDQVVIVMSARDPKLKPNLLDRFLVSAEKGGSDAIVAVNKCDLVDTARLQPLIGVFGRIGYEVIPVSATCGTNLDWLRRRLHDRQSVFTGQSGVGKSSLLNAIQPDLGLATKTVSEDSRKGRHTTRTAKLVELDTGGWVVDTPGIRQLALWDVIPEEVEGFFREFRPYVTRCRFPNCTHTHESGCGVKQAVDRGLVSPLRYRSYVQIVRGD